MSSDTVSTPRIPPPEMLAGVTAVVTAWKERLRQGRVLPDLIYHYCDANALLNILRTNSLWATSTRYLNDRNELISTLLNLPDHLKTLPDTAAMAVFKHGHFAELAKTAIQITPHAIGMEQFATCFSADGDLLSQWRAYGDDGRGFALGFDPSLLTTLAGDAIRNGDIRGMSYGAEPQRDLVLSLLRDMGAQIEPFADDLDNMGWQFADARPMTIQQWLGLRAAECVMELAFEAKDRSFRDEQEWRIYAREGEVRFRATPRGIVPYRNLDMTEVSSSRMPLKTIVMGPKLDSRDTERVLMYLAEAHGYGHAGIEILQSQSPYR